MNIVIIANFNLKQCEQGNANILITVSDFNWHY